MALLDGSGFVCRRDPSPRLVFVHVRCLCIRCVVCCLHVYSLCLRGNHTLFMYVAGDMGSTIVGTYGYMAPEQFTGQV